MIFKDTDNVKLSLKLSDKKLNVFPLATIYKNDDTFLSSHTLLVNGTKGYYTAIIAPGIIPVGSYSVIFEVFKDAGHTKRKGKYLDTESFLRIENIQATSILNKEEIINIIDDNDAQVTN